MSGPQEVMRDRISGAIERGEKEAITEKNYSLGTWIHDERMAYPTGSLRDSRRRARVLCADGKIRMATVGIADTYFTVPARVKVRGRSVSGYVIVRDPWKDPNDYQNLERAAVYCFHASRDGRNAAGLRADDADFDALISRMLGWETE